MTTLRHWIFIPTQEQTWLQMSLYMQRKSSWLEWKGLGFLWWLEPVWEPGNMWYTAIHLAYMHSGGLFLLTAREAANILSTFEKHLTFFNLGFLPRLEQNGGPWSISSSKGTFLKLEMWNASKCDFFFYLFEWGHSNPPYKSEWKRLCLSKRIRKNIRC